MRLFFHFLVGLMVVVGAEAQAGPLKITYGFTVKNQTGHKVVDGQLLTYTPMPQSGAGDDNLTVNQDYTVQTDSFGQRVLRVDFPEFPPFASKVITITALVDTQRQGLWPIANKDYWLQGQKHIEADHPQLMAKAKELTADSPELTAKQIYDFVSSHIQNTGYSGRARGALYALEHKQGDCTEYASLMVALARGAGIPARLMGGYVAQKNKVVRPEDYHNWAELYLSGRWLIVDPQLRKYDGQALGYIAFEIDTGDSGVNAMAGHHRFHLKGQGLKVRQNR